jgi:nucleotidyltransferase substrate binding protein (TIGR01987 family)
MNKKEIRWDQRFVNLKKAFNVLEKAVQIESPTEVERGGLIQFYEMTFELAWKTIKDYNESEGLITKSPRDAIKQAIQMEIIQDGHVWMDAIQDRNLTAHIYDEETVALIVSNIKTRYFKMLKDLIIELEKHEPK